MQEFIWEFFSYFGDIAYWLGFSISFLIVYPFLSKTDRKKTEWILKLLIPSILLAYFISFNLKLIFKVERPCAGYEYCPSSYSFPSGHATVAFAWISVLFAYKRKKVFWLLLPIPFLVALSRVLLNVHTLKDVIAGSLIGSSVGLGLTLFYKKGFDRRFLRKAKKYGFILRKIIHFSGILILFSYFMYGKSLILLFLIGGTLVYLFSEILRWKKIYFPLVHELTQICAYREELRGIMLSPIFYLLGLSFSLFLGEIPFLVGASSLIFGDFLAGLIGKNFGKHKLIYNKKKTLEGSLACFFGNFFFFLFFLSPTFSFLMALISAFIESILNRAENLVLPVSVALITKALIL